MSMRFSLCLQRAQRSIVSLEARPLSYPSTATRVILASRRRRRTRRKRGARSGRPSDLEERVDGDEARHERDHVRVGREDAPDEPARGEDQGCRRRDPRAAVRRLRAAGARAEGKGEGAKRVRLVREEGRGVSSQYGREGGGRAGADRRSRP